MSEFINTIDVLGDDAVIDSIINRTITEFKDDTVTEIGMGAFYDCKSLADIAFPNVKTVTGDADFVQGAFQNCTALTEVTDKQFPELTVLSFGMFRNCTSITKVSLSNITHMAWNALSGCTSITELNLPNLKDIGMNGGPPSTPNLKKYVFPALENISSYVFNWATYFECLDCGLTAGKALTIGANNFSNCPEFSTLIIRSGYVATLGGKIFGNTKIGSGTGYIYVPRALVEGYKSATNWSAYAAQIRALEDYTVDGTITGELDETKI